MREEARRSPPAERPTPLVRSRWSWRIGRIAGIPIRVHLTLALLLVWIAVSYSVGGVGLIGTFAGVLLVVILFAIITIHELGHALMAKRFGVRTREILLLPIGGMANLENMPERPSHELAIALVGPAINVVIAGLLWVGLELSGSDLDLGTATSLGNTFVTQLLWINVALALFNLIPAFPMDGGRALRALLSMRLGRERATAIAAASGKLFAIAFAIVGWFYNPWLVLIALVVWIGAKQEAELVRLRAALADVPVSAAMNRQITTVTSDERLDEAARLLVATGQDQLPIVDHGELIGVLTPADVAVGIAGSGATATVAAAPHHAVIAVAPNEPLDQVFDRLAGSPDTVAIVIEHGAPIGVVTPEQMARFVALRTRPASRH